MRFITSGREYHEIYAKNTKSEGNLFIFLRQKISEDLSAAGIIVNKKVGKAVVRNKVKRRVKAFLRTNSSKFPANQKLVIIAKPEAGTAVWQEIEQELAEFLIFQT